MLNGGNFDETRRRAVKLTLDAVTYSLLSFLFGIALFSIKNAKILFTDISIPSPLFQVFSIIYFLLFIVFSAALLLPTLLEFIEQILDWVASSALWHILTAIPFYLTVAFTLSCIVQGAITLPATIFSLPVEYIAAGWLAYVAVIMVIDMVRPDWREAIGNLFGGASTGNSDYLTRQLESPDNRPAPVASESEGEMRASNYGGGGGGGINWAFLLTGVFAVLVAGAFGYYYWQSTNTITARNLTISTQQAQITQLNTQVAGLTTDLATEQANSTSLLSQLTAANTQIVSKTTELSNSQLQATNIQANLQSQINTLTTDKAALQVQVDNMTSIVNLSASATQASAPISQSFGGLSTVASFTANYAGYLYITGTSSTANGYILVSDSNSYYPSNFNSNHYAFSTSGTVYVPVLPGTVTVSYGNTDSAGTIIANISVIYYY